MAADNETTMSPAVNQYDCVHVFTSDPYRCNKCKWDFRNGEPPMLASTALDAFDHMLKDRSVDFKELADARTAVAALIEREAALVAEHAEDQSVIAVWRGRCERAEAERDALAERVKALEELASASLVLIEEWDRNDENKFDIMPAKDWEKAEARFRSAIKSARAEARNAT